MAFNVRARKVCYRTLAEASGLAPKKFKALWKRIREELAEPENRIGFLGPYKTSPDGYRIWLEGFVSGGIGRLGWGNGVTEWEYGCEEDQDSITKFVQQMVRYLACDCRRTDRRRSLAARRASDNAVSTNTASSRIRETSPRISAHTRARARASASLREMQGGLEGPASVVATRAPSHAGEATLPSNVSSVLSQGCRHPSELPLSAKVITVDKGSTTFAEFMEIVAAQCPRPRSRAASAVAGVRVFWGGRGDFIHVGEGSAGGWDKVKQLLSEQTDTPGLAISVEFD